MWRIALAHVTGNAAAGQVILGAAWWKVLEENERKTSGTVGKWEWHYLTSFRRVNSLSGAHITPLDRIDTRALGAREARPTHPLDDMLVAPDRALSSD
jgi:hypothetical protein